MSCLDARHIQKLVEQIEAIKKTLESAGVEGQTKLKNIDFEEVLKEIPRTADGALDVNRWAGLGEGGQRERHSKLRCVLDALKAAAGPGAAKQPCGYGAALIATSILLPCAATLFTVIFVLVEWPINYSPLWGTLAAFLAWLALGLACCEIADATHAIPSSYSELLPRLDALEAGLKGFCPATGSPKNSCENNAYYEAMKENDEIRKDLVMKGLAWVLATGYSKVWGRLYRAEEAMIEVAPQKKVLEGAYYDEARLEGSDMTNRDDLLAKLRKAVVSIDPSAAKYLKSTAALTTPPALAIGTTALPGGTVGVGYCAPLLATGGVSPYKWAVIAGAIPDGLVLSTAGVLRGTPTSDGKGNFTVQVADSAGVAVEKYFDLLISPQTQAAQSPLAFSTTPPLPWGTVDVEYAERLFATGGKPPYKWKVIDGTIPDGMHLSNEGVLSGRPVRENAFEFIAEAADITDLNPINRKFTLVIKPSGTCAAAPVGCTQPQQMARAVLRHVRNSLNQYRNARWNGLILARNRLLATFMLTGMIVFALLAIAIMSGAAKVTIIAATVFYLVGATVGLCNRLRNESQAESAMPDYGLSAARLITIPLFSGMGAIGGLLFVAYLPFAAPVFGPQPLPTTSTAQVGAAEKPAVKPPAPVAAPSERGATEASAPAFVAAEKAATKGPAPAVNSAEKASPGALAPASGKTERVAPDKGAAQTAKQPDVTAEKSVPKPPAPAPAIAQKAASQALPSTKGVPEVAVPRTQQPEADGHARSTANEKVPQTPPNLEDIFDFKKNLIGLFVAAVFGLAPGLLFDRLQQQADRYKADLKSSKSTEEARKT